MAMLRRRCLARVVTVDEVSHIGSGVSYLQKFDLRMNEEHPPLPKCWRRCHWFCAERTLIIRTSRGRSAKVFSGLYGAVVFGEWLLKSGTIRRHAGVAACPCCF